MKSILVGLALVVTIAGPSLAAAPEDVANEISNNIMSPFCPGVTLHDCPSDTALELRREIQDWAESGMSRAEIMTELETQYGPEIRAIPEASGSGLFAWLLPLAGILVATAAGVVLSKRWAADRQPVNAPAVAATSEERGRLERELRGLRDGT